LDQNLGMFFQVVFLRFTPPLCIYSCSPSMWDLQFSSVSWLGPSTRKWGSWFRLREIEQILRSFFLLPHVCVSKFEGVSCFSRNDEFGVDVN
jgi:hypothetical protein